MLQVRASSLPQRVALRVTGGEVGVCPRAIASAYTEPPRRPLLCRLRLTRPLVRRRCPRLHLRSALGDDVVFDLESFLLMQEPHDVPFFRALTSTQSFSAFVTSCMQEMA